MKLTLKQKRFADEYIISGNLYQSAIKAGYSANYAKAQSHKLLENVGIQQYIEERQNLLDQEKVATMKEIQEFWASVLRNNDEDMKNRLKASEFIAKTKGAFVDKVEHSGKVTTEPNELLMSVLRQVANE